MFLWALKCNGNWILIGHFCWTFSTAINQIVTINTSLWWTLKNTHWHKKYLSYSFVLSLFIHLLIYYLESYFILHSWVVVLVLQFVISTHLVYYFIVVISFVLGAIPRFQERWYLLVLETLLQRIVLFGECSLFVKVASLS